MYLLALFGTKKQNHTLKKFREFRDKSHGLPPRSEIEAGFRHQKNHMKIFKTVDEADKYLNDLAAVKGIENYFIDEGTDKDGNDIMILIEESPSGDPIRNIETVIFQRW
jgi:hypothetical protein